MNRCSSWIAIRSMLAVAALAVVTVFPFAAHSQQRGAAEAAEVAVASGGCRPNAVKFKATKTFQNTTSQSLVDVIDSAINFRQSNAQGADCVVITFSGEAQAGPGNRMIADAYIDNRPCQPTTSFFAQSPVGTAIDPFVRSMNYVCSRVRAGNRTARIKFSSGDGGSVTLGYRSVTVWYVE